MPAIAANLRVIKATIKVGSDEYTSHIQDFKYTPTTPSAEVTDIGGTVHKFAGTAGWSLNLSVFQDFTATGLARKMLDDEGEALTLTIVDGPTTYTSTVTLVAPDIGGAPNTVGVSPLVLPSTKPTLTATA